MCGDEKKYHSKELKEVVNSNYIFSFGDQIEHIDPSSIFKDLKFPANYSSLLGDYIYQIMPKSWPDWMD